MNVREQKGLQIAALSKIKRKGEFWLVPSQSGKGEYKVKLDPQPSCTCPDYESQKQRCKHIYASQFANQREQTSTKKITSEITVTTATEPTKLRYKQVWSAYNHAQVNEKAKFLVLLHELCSGVDEPIQSMGRTRHPMSDMLFAAVYKAYSTVSTRRFMSDLKDAYLKKYISKLPCYNSVIGYLEKPEFEPYLQSLITRSSLPLKSIERNFAVDASGFSTVSYARWYDEKYGKEQSEKEWIKAHIICGTTTNVVTSVEVSGPFDHDTNYFASLVNDTAKRFNVEEVSADKAYSNYGNLTLVANKGAIPYIDFKKDAVGTGKCEIWNKMFHYYCMNKTDFMAHYHRRSNVESTFSMIKAKFGRFLRSKLPKAQVNELLCKILCHNLCCLIQSHYELGIQATFWEQ